MDGRRATYLAAGCMLLLLLLVEAVPADSESPPCRLPDCPHFKMIHHYLQLGCIRSDNSTACCPTSFNCSSLFSLNKTKCHYRGKEYEPGAHLEQEFNSVCIKNCVCIADQNGTSNGEASFECEREDCFKKLDFHLGCLPTYSVDRCCSTGLYCKRPIAGHEPYPECTYVGDRYLQKTGSDCLLCVCQAGLNGTFTEPSCFKITCEYTLKTRPSQLASCAPVFWRTDHCCAINLMCPSDDVIVVRHSDPPTEDDEQCIFGDHRLKIGDELRGDRKCKCEVPPSVTCTV